MTSMKESKRKWELAQQKERKERKAACYWCVIFFCKSDQIIKRLQEMRGEKERKTKIRRKAMEGGKKIGRETKKDEYGHVKNIKTTWPSDIRKINKDSRQLADDCNQREGNKRLYAKS